MIHRYEGNTGRMKKYPEHSDHSVGKAEEKKASRPSEPMPSPLSGLLRRLLPARTDAPETEDVLLLLILLLLYRESGDTELLMILGAMLFL